MKNSFAKDVAWWFFFLALILGYKLFFHELWKDEWQAWLVARDMSIGKMLAFLNYEGHPSLWYLYLMPFTLMSEYFNEEILLQGAHSLLGASVYFLIFRRFSMPFPMRILVAASYFLGFEYIIVNRGYVLLILLSMVAMLSLKSSRKIPFAISLFLLCQTEVYGVFFAAALLVYYILNKSDETDSLFLSVSKARLEISAFLFGIIAFVLTVYPRGHSDDFGRAYIGQDYNISKFFDAFYGMFANTFFIGAVEDVGISGSTKLGCCLSVLVFAVFLFIFYRNKALLITYLIMVVMMLTFTSLIYGGGLRQYGNFLVFMICLLELDSDQWKCHKLKSGMFVLLFVFPLIYNAAGLWQDAKYPYSNAKEAGQYLAAHVFKGTPVVAINKFEVGPVGAYAGFAFYELPEGVPFTYFKWLEKVYLPPQAELELFGRYKKTQSLFVISPSLLDRERYGSLTLIKAFDGFNMKRENYFLYKLEL